jgi:hypothetical protein
MAKVLKILKIFYNSWKGCNLESTHARNDEKVSNKG